MHEHVTFLNGGKVAPPSLRALLNTPWLLPSNRPNDLVLSPLRLPKGGREDFVGEIRGVLSREECRYLIECSEAVGYETATVSTNTGKAAIVIRNYRRSDRCMIDSDQIAGEVFGRIQHLLPDPSQILLLKNETRRWQLDSINPRLRFLRYDEGGFFDKHGDGNFKDKGSDGAPRRSFVTIQIYLNDGGGEDFEGGGTSFWGPNNESTTCVPEAGKVLLFSHPHLHSGDLLESGRKYAIRSDVMYKSVAIMRRGKEDRR